MNKPKQEDYYYPVTGNQTVLNETEFNQDLLEYIEYLESKELKEDEDVSIYCDFGKGESETVEVDLQKDLLHKPTNNNTISSKSQVKEQPQSIKEAEEIKHTGYWQAKRVIENPHDYDIRITHDAERYVAIFEEGLEYASQQKGKGLSDVKYEDIQDWICEKFKITGLDFDEDVKTQYGYLPEIFRDFAKWYRDNHYFDPDNHEEGCFPASESPKPLSELRKVYDKGCPILHEDI